MPLPFARPLVSHTLVVSAQQAAQVFAAFTIPLVSEHSALFATLASPTRCTSTAAPPALRTALFARTQVSAKCASHRLSCTRAPVLLPAPAHRLASIYKPHRLVLDQHARLVLSAPRDLCSCPPATAPPIPYARPALVRMAAPANSLALPSLAHASRVILATSAKHPTSNVPRSHARITARALNLLVDTHASAPRAITAPTARFSGTALLPSQRLTYVHSKLVSRTSLSRTSILVSTQECAISP